MHSILSTGLAEATAVFDPNPDMLREALTIAPEATTVSSMEALLALDLDGVVIATPSALHAEQSISALEAGCAVFCQKPLGRNGGEVEAVLDAARRADRLISVDLSYRHTRAVQALREKIVTGALGTVFAADLTFHNAYGPGAGWFWDPTLSGGGCLIDLGVHLVDLALWMFDFPNVTASGSMLLRGGRPVQSGEVEDYAIGWLDLANGVHVRIACSWNLSAGTDAVIQAAFHGTQAGGAVRNVDGSFFDFTAELYTGRSSSTLVSPPDDWSGRAAVEWVHKLAQSKGYRASSDHVLASARVLDRLYAQEGCRPSPAFDL
jgi:predicted dehydrogenase